MSGVTTVFLTRRHAIAAAAGGKVVQKAHGPARPRDYDVTWWAVDPPLGNHADAGPSARNR